MKERQGSFINKCRKAIHENKDIKYYLKKDNNNDTTIFYEPILEDDFYLHNIDDMLDLYKKQQ